jgi:glycerol-3-phosphate acyltransferase PlsY
VLAFAGAAALVVVVRHRENLRRLIQGQELKA